jgi:sigma-E factor negative regulatory protein RseA
LLPQQAGLRVAQGGGRARGWTWVGASAVAAGFVAVAGVLVLTRTPGVAPGALQPGSAAAPESVALAPVASAQPAAPVVAATGVSPEPQTIVASGKVIRDARLDRYLAAHKQFAGTSALGVPSGFLRAATSESVDR